MKNFSPIKHVLFKFSKNSKHYLFKKGALLKHSLLLVLIITLHSCASSPKRTYTKQDLLIQKYREMRMKSWRQYKQTRGIEITTHSRPKANTVKKGSKQTSVSMKHLKDNPIFQQVTQIHCFKIRASESRCNAIKYLAMTNCGNITKESQIKKYTKCLEKNFK